MDRLGYAITPRFAPSCSEAQLRGAGELAAKYPDVWIQSHVAENVDEIAWARALFPDSRSYLAIYADHGLMRRRAVYAHCIHFHDDDRALMRDTHTAGAARALDLDGMVGNLQPGCEADFVVLNPHATPLLARRTRAAGSLAELLFALIVLGDDRVVERTVISQAK